MKKGLMVTNITQLENELSFVKKIILNNTNKYNEKSLKNEMLGNSDKCTYGDILVNLGRIINNISDNDTLKKQYKNLCKNNNYTCLLGIEVPNIESTIISNEDVESLINGQKDFIAVNELTDFKRRLKAPAIYKHFKGMYYATIGEVFVVNEVIFAKEYINQEPTFIGVQETESDELLNIYLIDSCYIGVSNNLKQSKYVLYKSLYDTNGIYLREIEMFLSLVDKKKYKEVKSKYRFTEV